MTYVPNLLSRVNLTRLYPTDRIPVMTFCPNHHDTTKPNLAVYPTNAYCFACPYHEGALHHIARVLKAGKVSRNDSSPVTKQEVMNLARELMEETSLVRTHSVRVLPPIDNSLAEGYHKHFTRSRLKREHLWKRYGLNKETTSAALIGHTTGRAYSIPVYSRTGELVTIRFRRDDAVTTEGEKYWSLSGRGATTIFLPPSLRGPDSSLAETVGRTHQVSSILLTEGELDALALDQLGIPAVSWTNGAKALLDAGGGQLGQLSGLRRVFVCYDQDEAGQNAGRQIVQALDGLGIPARLLTWDRTLGKDASELVAAGFGPNQLRALWTPG